MATHRPGYPVGYLSKRAKELGVSRQRMWQILQKLEGKCALCPTPVYRKNGAHCKIHLDISKQRQRKRNGTLGQVG